MISTLLIFFFFFFNDTATTEIYTLSLHDALPIFRVVKQHAVKALAPFELPSQNLAADSETGVQKDRKSTRLNSSHDQISYAVFCLKKKKNKTICLSHVLHAVCRYGRCDCLLRMQHTMLSVRNL